MLYNNLHFTFAFTCTTCYHYYYNYSCNNEAIVDSHTQQQQQFLNR